MSYRVSQFGVRSNSPSQGLKTDSQHSKRRKEAQKKTHKRSNQERISPLQSQRSKKGKSPQQKTKSEKEKKDLNNEDLVIFLILTQAAKTIQRAWRNYKQRQRDTTETHWSPYLSHEINGQSDTPAQTYSQDASCQKPNKFVLKRQSSKPLKEKKSHRRPTFSFGQEIQPQTIYSMPPKSPRQQPVTLMGPETIVMESGSDVSDVKQSKTPPVLHPKHRPVTEKVIPLKQGNVPVEKLIKQTRTQDENFIISMTPAVSDSNRVKPVKKVFEYAGNLLRDAPQVFESQFSKNTGPKTNQTEMPEERLIMNYGIDEDESNSKQRGKFISRVAQQSEEDSFTASVAEKTDRIINYSAVMNTSEELIEAAVNNSSTLHAPENTQGMNQSSQVNSSLLHKILPSSKPEETSIDKKLDLKLDKGITFDPKERYQIQMFRPVSSDMQRINHAYSTSKQTVQVQSQISHHYMGSVISGSGMLLPSLHSIEQSSQLQSHPSNQKSETNTPALQLLVPQLHNMSSSESLSSQRSPSPIRYVSNSCTDGYNFIDRQNISFQNALYQQNQYSFEGISHHSMPPIEHEATHSGNLLNHYGHVTSANNTNGSYFLHTNTSIFERNPFRDYTTTKLQEMLQNKHDLQEIIQIKEDAIEYAKNLEKGWITRQEKLAELSPRSLQRKRFELESWVTVSKSSKPSDKKSFSSSASLKVSSPRAVTIGTIEEERKQVAKIIEMVNKKSDEIKGKLIRKHDPEVKEETKPEVKSEEELEISIDEEANQAPMPKPTQENAKFADAIVDQILQDMLAQELSAQTLGKTLKRQPQQKEYRPEVMPNVEYQVDLDNSISIEEQIIAGVDTSLEAVEQYIEGIFSQIRIRGKQFMGAFYTPIFKNPLSVLSNLQRQHIGQGSLDQMDLSNTLASILNVQLYLTLEKARENVIREALQQIKDMTKGESLAQEENLSELLSESDHIHNKAIFDSVNEALNLYRPYGANGEPMPWSVKSRQNFFIYASEDMLEDVLTNVKTKLMEWATTRAGQLSSINVQVKEEGKLQEANVIRQQQVEITDETLQLHRERCLAKLLAQDLMAAEEKWIDYEHEETQTKLDLADIVLEHLVSEIVTEMQSLQSK